MPTHDMAFMWKGNSFWSQRKGIKRKIIWNDIRRSDEFEPLLLTTETTKQGAQPVDFFIDFPANYVTF